MTETTDGGGAPSANPLPHFINVLVSPVEAFGALKSRTLFLYPFFAVILAQALMIFYYYQVVDFPWFINDMVANLPEDTPRQTRDMVAESQMKMGAGVLGIISAVSITVVFPVVFLLFAGYLALVSLARGDGIKFGQWFGLVCWSAVPALIASAASMVTISLSEDGRLGQADINPLTLNNLFFQLRANEPGASFFNTVDLSALWSMVLVAIGYRTWTGKKSVASTVIVLLPGLLLYGSIALFSFS